MKTVILFIFRGFITLQLNGLHKKYWKINKYYFKRKVYDRKKKELLYLHKSTILLFSFPGIGQSNELCRTNLFYVNRETNNYSQSLSLMLIHLAFSNLKTLYNLQYHLLIDLSEYMYICEILTFCGFQTIHTSNLCTQFLGF